MIGRLLVAFVLFFGLCGQTLPPVKRALIIANADYRMNFLDLDNPTVDANAVSLVLGSAGFQVTQLTNATADQIRVALRWLHDVSHIAPPGSVIVIYYAGHGNSFQGTNYIWPVEIDPTTSTRLLASAIPIDELLVALPRNSLATSVLIVDACRDVPQQLLTAVSSPGFVRQDAPANTFIAFSTAQGSTATDGVPQAGSPFANGLRSVIPAYPGMPIPLLFQRVRSFVSELAEGQTPTDYSSLLSFVSISGEISPRSQRTYLGLQAFEHRLDEEAVYLMRRSAEEGDVQAMRSLGYAYREGRGVRRDDAETLRWLERASRAGGIDEQLDWAMHANLLSSESAVRQRARTLIATISANGNARAQFAHGNLLVDLAHPPVRVISADYAEAARLFESAARAGHGAAAHNLGLMYQLGVGVEQSREHATEWYRVAAQAGVVRGMVRLGGMLSSFGTGARSLEPDREARRWYERAVRHGDVEAMYRLALLTYFQIGLSAETAAVIARNVDGAAAIELNADRAAAIELLQQAKRNAPWPDLDRQITFMLDRLLAGGDFREELVPLERR